MNGKKSVARNDATATTLSYPEMSATMSQALDTIASLIPTSPLKDAAPVAYIRRRLGVSPEMIASAIATSEALPRFRGIMDVTDASDTLALYDALRPVLSRMMGICEDMRLSIEARLAKTGGEALHVYAAAQRIAQDPGEAEVAAYLQSMAAYMPKGKGNRRRKTPPETAPPSADPLPLAQGEVEPDIP